MGVLDNQLPFMATVITVAVLSKEIHKGASHILLCHCMASGRGSGGSVAGVACVACVICVVCVVCVVCVACVICVVLKAWVASLICVACFPCVV